MPQARHTCWPLRRATLPACALMIMTITTIDDQNDEHRRKLHQIHGASWRLRNHRPARSGTAIIVPGYHHKVLESPAGCNYLPQQARELLNLARSVIRSALAGQQIAILLHTTRPCTSPPARLSRCMRCRRIVCADVSAGSTQPSRCINPSSHAAQSVLYDPRFGGDRVRPDELGRISKSRSACSPRFDRRKAQPILIC